MTMWSMLPTIHKNTQRKKEKMLKFDCRLMRETFRNIGMAGHTLQYCGGRDVLANVLRNVAPCVRAFSRFITYKYLNRDLTGAIPCMGDRALTRPRYFLLIIILEESLDIIINNNVT